MMLKDCMASFGIRLKEHEYWTEEQTAHLFALGQQYAQCVQANPFGDVLGHVYQELVSSYGKKMLGQFFTPASIARMTAEINYSPELFENQETVRFLEPTVGSSVMPLQFMSTVHNDNPEYLRKLSITGVDLDIVCVQMSTLQLLANNLIHQLNLGEIAVFHGDSLGRPDDLVQYFGASTEEFLRLAKIQDNRDEKPENSEANFPHSSNQLELF